MFKTGDRCYSLTQKWVDIEVLSNRIYIETDAGNRFNRELDGRIEKYDAYPDLYFGIPEIIAPPEPIRVPEFKSGKHVLVRSSGDTEWISRIFSHWDHGSDLMRCYWAGDDEFNNNGSTKSWEEWKLPDCVLSDGSYNDEKSLVEELRKLSKKHNINIWTTPQHRNGVK